MIETEDIRISLRQLVLDPNNYRLADEKEESQIADENAESLQNETLARLKKQRLGELKDSIINNGFLEMERIVVRLLNTEENLKKKNPEDKKYIVVEGNRRTAALKSIQEDYTERVEENGEIKYKKGISEKLINKFDSINVQFIEGDAKTIQDYSATLMGIRHVAGPKKWDGFQSAKLINDLFYEGRSFTEIGNLIGITNREVGRRFRGYQAFKQMKKDEDFGGLVGSRHYGLLLEFLSSSKSGKEWLKWNDTTYQFDETKNLEIVYKAITPRQEEPPEIRNPGDARKFVSLLGTEYREDIEKGQSIHSMPDPDDLKPTGKLKRIISFISFVEKSNFSQEEEEKLADLLNVIKGKIGE
ncbi:MAG: hypothetical protein VX729_15560 [Pseudomonadota bacterium]|nr:hypothetical protein [Pseudomonadota bacterium]